MALRWLLAAVVTAILSVPAPVAAQQALQCRAEIKQLAPPVNACQGSKRVTIAAVGDVLLHGALQRRGYSDPRGFRGLWGAADPFLKAADIAYANLEGPVAPGITKGFGTATDPGAVFDNRVYSSYPLFNYHPQVIADLKASGVDIVSTANNHSLDRGSRGADLTIAHLERARMPYTGTIRAGAPRAFSAYTKTNIGTIAWIACSYSTNGISDPNRQVLMCYKDRQELLALVAAEATRKGIAAVIVTPHWGYEYQHSPNRNQKALAAELVAAGATVVIGTHPHVVQPWEYRPGSDGTQSLVIYSTGNFVSGQGQLNRRTGALAWIELCRSHPSRDLARDIRKRLVVANAGWVPVVMARTARGPELLIGASNAGGLAAQGYQVAARYLPENRVQPTLVCKTEDNQLVTLQ